MIIHTNTTIILLLYRSVHKKTASLITHTHTHRVEEGDNAISIQTRSIDLFGSGFLGGKLAR